jgi:DNA-binding transcriptional MerR regulator
MFKIGVFARLGQVSVRTLRFYEELGLLSPAHVDDQTGYRYYGADQIPRLNRILALRDLGLSLEGIALVLERPLSAERLGEMLREKRCEIEGRIERERETLARVAARLRQIESEGIMPDYEVVLKRVEPQLVASIRDVIPDVTQINATFNRLFDEVYAYAGARGAKCNGLAIDLWHDPEPREENMEVEACAPVAAPIPESERVRVYELPGVEQVASTTHHGGFDAIEAAHRAVLQWAESSGYRVNGPGRELYHVYDRNGDPGKWVTEIQYPVARV